VAAELVHLQPGEDRAMNMATTIRSRSMLPTTEPRPAARPHVRRDWPMTREAWHRLVVEVEELRAHVLVLAGDTNADDDVVQLPIAQAVRRLETLSAVLAGASRIDDARCAVIGRRATLREEDGETFSFRLVFPGDGEPAQGWISADSPLGAAVLGARPGDVVNVTAPAGKRAVTLVAVE
jgi:transcription elongation GreA/GreB family factor